MIYFLYGSDFSKVRTKLREIIVSQQKKNPDASYFKIEADTWRESSLEELLGSAGLFQNKYLIVLDGVFGDKKTGEKALPFLKDMANSQNIFIIVEGELTKEVGGKIEKKAEKTQHFSSPLEKTKKKSFDVFALTDAFGVRDKKQLWVLYQRALLEGVSTEEIHRLLLWQVKAILAVFISKDVRESGLNPFVYKKAASFSRNFSKEELINLETSLVIMYHDARRGVLDFDIGLERFVLNI